MLVISAVSGFVVALSNNTILRILWLGIYTNLRRMKQFLNTRDNHLTRVWQLSLCW